jgi:hypothetical protein
MTLTTHKRHGRGNHYRISISTDRAGDKRLFRLLIERAPVLEPPFKLVAVPAPQIVNNHLSPTGHPLYVYIYHVSRKNTILPERMAVLKKHIRILRNQSIASVARYNTTDKRGEPRDNHRIFPWYSGNFERTSIGVSSRTRK